MLFQYVFVRVYAARQSERSLLIFDQTVILRLRYCVLDAPLKSLRLQFAVGGYEACVSNGNIKCAIYLPKNTFLHHTSDHTNTKNNPFSLQSAIEMLSLI